jgi:hypothetical protein
MEPEVVEADYFLGYGVFGPDGVLARAQLRARDHVHETIGDQVAFGLSRGLHYPDRPVDIRDC